MIQEMRVLFNTPDIVEIIWLPAIPNVGDTIFRNDHNYIVTRKIFFADKDTVSVIGEREDQNGTIKVHHM